MACAKYVTIWQNDRGSGVILAHWRRSWTRENATSEPLMDATAMRECNHHCTRDTQAAAGNHKTRSAAGDAANDVTACPATSEPKMEAAIATVDESMQAAAKQRRHLVIACLVVLSTFPPGCI